jgi:hypothetical protein
MSVIVYTRASSEDCAATLREMDKYPSIVYELRTEEELPFQRLEEDEKFALVDKLIFSTPPPRPRLPKVVTPYGDSWSGHRPEAIKKLAEDMAMERKLRDQIIERRNRAAHDHSILA